MPVLAVDLLGHAGAVWVDRRNGNDDLYAAQLPVFAPAWSPNLRADDDPFPAPASDPAVAIGSHGEIYAVWRAPRTWPNDGDIYFAIWEPGAASWTPGIRVNNDPVGFADQRAPAIAVDSDGNVHVVWQDYRNGAQDPDIYWAKRAAQSGVWSSNQRVNDDFAGGFQANPALTVDRSNNAYAIWEDSRNGRHLYAARLPADGIFWGTNRRVTADATDPGPQNPDIAVDGGGNTYAVWEDYGRGTQNPDILFAVQPPGNSVWGPAMRVNDDSGTAAQHTPAIAASDSGVVYAVWQDYRNGFTDPDIYIAWWLFGDVRWRGNRRVNRDTGSAPQSLPDIAMDGNRNAYVIWQDSRDPQSRPDIYFAFIGAADLPTSYLPLILKGG